MIRLAAAAIAAAIAFSAPATAQSSLDAAPQGFDWTGVYGGLSYSVGYEADITADLGPPDTTAEPEALGFYGGYLHQFGQYVAGVEVHAVAYNAPPARFRADLVRDIFEVRVRGGYAFDRLLVSGSVGYAAQSYFAGNIPATANLEGITYGLGVDYALPNNLTIGAEYVARDMDGFLSVGSGNLRARDESFRIRFGIRF